MAPLGAVAMVATLVTTGMTISASAVGASPVAPSCPSLGTGVGCAYVVTVSPSGGVSVTAGANTSPLDGESDDVMIGIANNSNALLDSVTLQGHGSFGFDGDGLCAYEGAPSSCVTASTGYEGPGTSFSNYSSVNTGTVVFTSPLAPGGQAYFSLEAPPSTSAIDSASFSSDVSVTATPVVATEGLSFTGTAATFTDLGSTAAASEFNATINWGDGTTSSCTTSPTSPCSVTGSNGTYSVSGTHVYAEEGTYGDTVSVTDSQLSVNAGSATGSAAVADAKVVASPETITPKTTGLAFTTPIASFTDANPGATASDFTASIIWGDGTTSTCPAAAPATCAITSAVGGFVVTATHTYATHATNTAVIVTVNDVGGSYSTATDNAVLVADAVTSCSAGTSCSGVDNTKTEQVNASTNNPGSGFVLISTDPSSTLNCGDSFRHAPTVVDETDTFSPGSSSITVTDTFPEDLGTKGKGLEGLFFAVCFASNKPFTDAYGKSTELGLLPICNPFKVGPGPCVNYILPGKGDTIVERITYPAGDPRYG